MESLFMKFTIPGIKPWFSRSRLLYHRSHLWRYFIDTFCFSGTTNICIKVQTVQKFLKLHYHLLIINFKLYLDSKDKIKLFFSSRTMFWLTCWSNLTIAKFFDISDDDARIQGASFNIKATCLNGINDIKIARIRTINTIHNVSYLTCIFAFIKEKV